MDGKPPSPPGTPAPPEQPPAATPRKGDAVGEFSLQRLGNDVVVTATGRPVLRHLHPGATVRQDASGGGLALGFDTQEPPSSLLDIEIGQLSCERFVALARAKLYWCIPAWGASAADVPVETQMLLLDLGGGWCALLMPLIDANTFRSSLRPPRAGANPSAAGRLILRVESGDESVRGSAFASALYVAAGRDPYELIDRGVAAAARLSGAGRPRAEKEVPASLDVFGWCTWDACYTDVNPASIQAGLRALAAGGAPVRMLVIDDGWQQTDLDEDLRRHSVDSVVRSVQGWSADAIQLRRKSAELVFQDLQVTEPLKFMEKERRAEEAKAAAAAGLLRRWARWALGSVTGALYKVEGAVAAALKSLLEETSSDTSRIELFTAVATGPFRRALLRFYASASSHSRRLLSVKANGKFKHMDEGPDAPLASASASFGEVVRGLKQQYGVRYVLCWHALAGYWSGVMPPAYGAAIKFPRPSPGTLEVDASMRWVHPAVTGVGVPADERKLHHDMHAYLAESGVDGVKVDVQATVAMFGWDCGGYSAISSRFHSSLEDSVARHLPGNHHLNSMCCSLEDLYQLKNSNIARVGEDFYPLLEASHTAHIANAAFTTLLVGALAFPDWDMFHSRHDSAALHAAARAVSGGLVYVSDRVGDHDFELLRRLVLPDGSVLRCLLPARPSPDCLFADISRDRATVLKVWNLNPCTGVVGAFNVQGAAWSVKRRAYFMHDKSPPALRVGVGPADVPYLPRAERYAVWSDARKELRVLGQDERWELVLAGRGGHDLFTISPLLSAPLRGGALSVAPIGLVDMLNAGGAVRAAALELDGEGSVSLSMRIKGCGRFFVHASAPAAAVLVDGREVGTTWEEGRQEFEVSADGDMEKNVRLAF